MSTSAVIVTDAGTATAFGSVGAGYATIRTVTGALKKLVIASTLDQEAVLSLDGGTTDWMVIPANFTMVLDFNPDLIFSGVMQLKHNGVAPLSGKFITAVMRSF